MRQADQALIRKLITATRPDAVVAGDLLIPRLASVAIPITEIAKRVVDRALRQLRIGQST